MNSPAGEGGVAPPGGPDIRDAPAELSAATRGFLIVWKAYYLWFCFPVFCPICSLLPRVLNGF